MENTEKLDWALAYTTNEEYKASILIELLEEKGIPAQEINKKDSSFNWGDIEIYVPKQNLTTAQTFIDEHPDL